MSRDSVYRYECGICTSSCFARGLPLNWVGTHVGFTNDDDDSDWVYLCPKHADILIEQVPRKLLHPEIRIERGSFAHERAFDASPPKPGIVESMTEAFTSRNKP